jgi:aminopeptidase N
MADVFGFCTEHFGPLQYLNDGKLKLVQTSVFNFGGNAFDGISVMSEEIFSVDSLTDPLKGGASGVELLAHEIVHQWWGLNRMISDDEESPEWSAEGLTVYSTYRLYKEKYGEEYARKNYVDVWQREVDAMNRNFYRRHPEYLEIMPETFAERIRAGETNTAKYRLMPLKILKAEELVGGEAAFDAILSELACSNQGVPMTYQEFLDACGLTKEALEIE